MKDTDTPKLDWWFLNPASELENNRSEKSDGAFLVLGASIALYERYLIKLKPGTDWEAEGVREKIISDDLGISAENAAAFWDCFRNGLQHQFQPKRKIGGKWVYSWDISAEYGESPEVQWTDTKSCSIKLNPWAFARLVRDKYEANPNFFEAGDSHKPGEVIELAPVRQSNGQAQTLAGSAPPPFTQQSQNKASSDYQTESFSTGVFKPVTKPKSPPQ